MFFCHASDSACVLVRLGPYNLLSGVMGALHKTILSPSDRWLWGWGHEFATSGPQHIRRG